MKRLLIMLFILSLAGCGGETTPTAPTTAPAQPTPQAPDVTTTVDLSGMEINLMQISGVSVSIRESNPVQVSANIGGVLNDGCTETKGATQTREGNTINIKVETMRPKGAMCTQELKMLDFAVALNGDFPPGEYTVNVNGVSETFTVK